MKQTFFLEQMNRLKSRFGPKNFDIEFIKVVGIEIASVSEEFFMQTVNTWIGERKTSQPPLRSDFRDCRLAYEKTKLNTVVEKAAQTFHYGLKDVLKKHYKVDTLSEAMELERMKIKLGQK